MRKKTSHYVERSKGKITEKKAQTKHVKTISCLAFAGAEPWDCIVYTNEKWQDTKTPAKNMIHKDLKKNAENPIWIWEQCNIYMWWKKNVSKTTSTSAESWCGIKQDFCMLILTAANENSLIFTLHRVHCAIYISGC